MFSTASCNQTIEINNQISIEETNIEEIYDVLSTSEWIINNDFQKIGLQFPDELLPVATPIIKLLKTQTNRTLIILGDTSFGSCCVDIVAGQHYNIDAIVHYGRACLTNSIDLPVKYVFGKETLPSKDLIIQYVTDKIPTEEKLCIVYDFQFYSDANSLFRELSKTYSTIFSWPCNSSDHNSDLCGDPVTKCARYFSVSNEEEINSTVLVYIGHGGLTFDNILLTFSGCKDFYSFNPVSGMFQNQSTRLVSLIKRRRFLIEKCRDAQRVGILVGSLSVENYLTCIDYLRSCIKSAGKLSYTFVVGKLNIAKLANFPEIDVFVLVACPENVLICSREYYKPIVTPFEMELACNPDLSWTTEPYPTDFNAILPGGKWYFPISQERLKEIYSTESGDMSLISGNVRCAVSSYPNEAYGEGALVTRNDLQVAEIQKQAKSWRGLDPKLGETPVSGIVKGRKGIAIGYEDEVDDRK